MSSPQRRKGGADIYDDIDVSQLPSVPVEDSSAIVFGGRPLAQVANRMKVTRVGLAVQARDFEEWESFGRVLKEIQDGLQFAIGDWLLQGERRWGARYASVAEEMGFKIASLKQFVWVCRNVQLSIRIDDLKFGHHALVASIEPNMQRHWLTRASAGGWSIARMRGEMENAKSLPRTGQDWYANWFAPRVDALAAKARKATDAEKRLAIDQLRALADELEGK